MKAKTLFLSGLTLAAVVGVAVTAPTIDPTTYEVTAAPKSVLVTFYDGPDTRGFAWETDTSVSETKLWLVEGSHTSAESALFDAATPAEGSYVDRTQGSSPAKTVRCHKAHATDLVSGTTYSYRVGGSGNYVYGTFKVDTAAGARTILYIGDSQVKYTPSFFVWENTVQRAAEVLPAAETDLVLFGGDMFDVYATSISAYNYLKWGATVDSATPYYPGVPWSLSSGNHDLDKSGYTYYADLTGVNYQTPSCHSYDFGAAHIAVLPFYSVTDDANVQAVAAWTDADLKAANAAGKTKWNVVMMHLGPYTTGDHGMNESSSIVELFCPIFSSNHVDLVLQAHDHTYSKTLPYKWDTVGYTTTRTDATIVNTVPAQTKIGGETYDANPAGTYYVSTGCSGPRVYEGEGAYAFLDGAQSYDTHRTYKVAAGTIAVDSAYGKKGDDASSELRAAMFGVLKVDETTLTYDWYAVNTNGLEAAVLYDTLRIAKGNTFRVTPYVQRPTTNAVSLLWLAQTNGNASVTWWEQGGATTNAIASATEIAPTDRVAGTRFTAEGVIQYCVAPELAYTNSVEAADNYPAYTREGVGTNQEGAGWAMSYTVPYQYRVRLTGLKADTLYGYRVTLADGASYEKTFRTAPAAWRPIRFAYFSDSETEPADNPLSTGRTGDWTSQADPTKTRIYYATQTEAYATNVARVVEFDPDFIVMAGDLAQKGSRQLDWDEFWRHNAGLLNDPAGSRPIFASPGNHDYWSYLDGGEAGMKKYLSYFEFEPNGAAVDADIQERFHRVDYGVATFLFMDANNGDDSDYTKDTNRYIARENSDYSPYAAPQGRGCRAPDFNPGTPQYQWLETQLADAQKKSAFIFVVCHQCPYSVGDHGQPNVPDGTGGEILSGRALRVLEPLFHKYGVTAWLCGHDEMMERSTVTGTETCLDGTTREHTLQIWDMGIAGDGLRGGMKIANPQEQYRAYVNSIELYDAQGFQTDGGVHYGHLEVTITNRADGAWVATFDPVYEFFTTNAAGQAVFGGTRHYGDKLSVVNTDWIDGPKTYDWTGSGGDWTDTANWKVRGAAATDYPRDVTNDTARLGTDAAVTLDADVAVKALKVSGDVTLSGAHRLFSDTFAQTGGTFTVTGATLTNETEFIVGGAGTGAVTLRAGANSRLSLTSATNVFGTGAGSWAKLVVSGGSQHLISRNVTTGVSHYGQTAGSTGVLEIVNATLSYPGYGSYGGGSKCYPPDLGFGAYGGGVGRLSVSNGALYVASFRLRGEDSSVDLWKGGSVRTTLNNNYFVDEGVMRLHPGSSVTVPVIWVGSSHTGRVEVTGATVTLGNGESQRMEKGVELCSANSAASRGELYLGAQGVLVTTRLNGSNRNFNRARGGLGCAAFESDGGIVRASTPYAEQFCCCLDDARVGKGGLTIDSQAYAITIAQNFSNRVDKATGLPEEGTLTLTGSGTKTLSSTHLGVSHLVLAGGTTILKDLVDTTGYDVIVTNDAVLSLTGDAKTLSLDRIVFGSTASRAILEADVGASLRITSSAKFENLGIRYNGTMTTDAACSLFVLAGNASAELQNAWRNCVTILSGAPDGTMPVYTVVYDSEKDETTFVVTPKVDPYAGKTFTWLGATADWETASNWSSGILPVSVSEVVFPEAATVKAIDLPYRANAASLAFTGTGDYTVAGDGRLSLVGADGAEGAPITVAAGEQTIGVDLANLGSNVVTVADGAKLTLSGTQANGGFVKRGNGVLEVTGDYAEQSGVTGSFSFEEGYLRVGAKSAGPGAAKVVLPVTQSTLEIVNDTDEDVALPYWFTLSDLTAERVMDLCVKGDVTLPQWTKSGTAFESFSRFRFAKRGPGRLTLVHPSGVAPYVFGTQGGNATGGEWTLDADGRLATSGRSTGNLLLLEGELVVRSTAGVCSMGAGASFGLAIARPFKGESDTVRLVLDSVSTGPTGGSSFGDGLTAANSNTRFVSLVLTNNATFGMAAYASGISQPLSADRNAAVAVTGELVVAHSTYISKDTQGASLNCNPSSLMKYRVTDGGTFRAEKFDPVCNFDLVVDDALMAGLDGSSPLVVTNDSETVYAPSWRLLSLSSVGGAWDWFQGSMTFRNGGEFRCSFVDIPLHVGASCLKFRFDGGKWTVGSAGTVDLSMGHAAPANIVVEALAGGLEFPVASGQTVRFAKRIDGAGGVIKSGAGTLVLAKGEYRLNGVTTVCTGDDALTLSCTGTSEVRAGTMRVESGAMGACAAIAVASGASLDLGGNSASGLALSGAGAVANATVTDPTLGVTLSDDHQSVLAALNFASSVTLDGCLTVDLGLTSAAKLEKPYPQNLVIARYAGTAPSFTRVKVIGTGGESVRSTVTAADGEIRLTVTRRSGVAIVVR